MREELHESLVASDTGQIVKNFKELRDLGRNLMLVVLASLLCVYLHELHDRFNDLREDWIKNGGVFLVLHENVRNPVLYVRCVLATLDFGHQG